jgi:alpha/beta hydrolase fold
MVMADRPEVNTAPGPIAVVDTVVLAQQLVAAAVRVPFRAPLRGPSNAVANLGTSVTREAVRAFMGYASSLPIDEFRSIEQLLDNVCRVVMPPVVSSLGVSASTTEFGGVPGVLYLPRGRPATGVILYLHGGGYIGTSPRMYAFFTARLCRETQCAIFVADYRLAPEFPYPAGVEDAVAVLDDLLDRGVPAGRLIVAGDSGGGGLANTLVLELPARAPGRECLPPVRQHPRAGARRARPRSSAARGTPGGVPLVPCRIERVERLADRTARLEVGTQLRATHLPRRRPITVATRVAREVADGVTATRLARQPLDERHLARPIRRRTCTRARRSPRAPWSATRRRSHR